MNLAQLYKSLPLRSSSACIRVFDVRGPSSADDGGPIHGTLRVLSLDDQPPQSFTALSYVWGTYAVQRHTISYGLGTFEVTANCYSALLHLRKAIGSFTIWIDAICINQSDDIEKSQQLSLMGRIYAEAIAVYIWLGEGSVESSRAMDYLATAGLLDFFYDKTTSNGGRPNVNRREWAAAWYACRASWTMTNDPFPRDKPQWPMRWLQLAHIARMARNQLVSSRDLNSVLNSEWITRMWTFQEASLASNPIIVVGSKRLLWSRFAMSIIFVDFIRINWDFLVYPVSTPPWRGLLFSRARLFESRTNLMASPLHLPILSSLAPLSLTEYLEYRRYLESLSRIYSRVRYLDHAFFVAMMTVCLLLVATSSGPISIFLVLLALMSLLISFRDGLKVSIRHKEDSYSMDIASGAAITREICARKATNERDKAFALHAVFQRLAIVPEIPDYSKSIAQVFLELTIQLVQATNSLQFLVPAAIENLPGHPSWVPNWAMDFENSCMSPSAIFDQQSSNVIGLSVASWRLLSGNRLAVYGQSPLTVMVLCGPMMRTSDEFDEEEIAVHEKNYRQLQEFYRCCEHEVKLSKLTEKWRKNHARLKAANDDSMFSPNLDTTKHHRPISTKNPSF